MAIENILATFLQSNVGKNMAQQLSTITAHTAEIDQYRNRTAKMELISLLQSVHPGSLSQQTKRHILEAFSPMHNVEMPLAPLMKLVDIGKLVSLLAMQNNNFLALLDISRGIQ